MNYKRYIIVSCIIFFILNLGFVSEEIFSGLNNAEPIGAFLNGNMPTRMDLSSGNFEVVESFPNLKFDDAIFITHHPNEDRLLVTTWGGEIYHFANNQNVSQKILFADLKDRSAPLRGGNLLGMAFHPEFGQANSPNNKYVYIYYAAIGNNGENAPTNFESYTCVSNSRNFGTYMRLSRFEVNDNFTLNKSTELRMFNYRLINNSHRGGGLLFSDDGFLYLSLGDQSRFTTAQDISNNFEGGVIRIDVDQDPSKSHAPIRILGVNNGFPDEYSGIGYWIPNDNPFLSPQGNLFEEFYAVGLRNPFKMTKDRASSDIWIGDVGHSQREEVDILAKGANFGWPRYEGDLEGTISQCNANQLPITIGTYTPPLAAYDRSEANSITGGFVYRGSSMPSLYGKYIWADHVLNTIYAVDKNSGTTTTIGTFSPTGATTFGEDINGELYIGKIGSNKPLYRLNEVGGNNTNTNQQSPPQFLSQIGAFSNLNTLQPAQGVLPYDMIEDFWSDGADKKRWIAIPNNGTHNTTSEQIKFSEDGDWEFPIGTVMIKHFDFQGKKLETRFEVHGDNGNYYYLTYKWNAAGTDAVLLEEGLDETFNIGGISKTWHFPSRQECLSCHSPNSGSVIGLKTRYLNKSITYPQTGITANQLVTLSSIGAINQSITVGQAANFLTAAPKDDNSASLEFRARSYLDLNCSYCHRPETGNRANFNALLNVPLNQQELINGNVIDELGIPGAKVVFPGDHTKSTLHHRASQANTNISMPPLAKLEVDPAGIDLIKDWINSLDPNAYTSEYPKVIEFSDAQNGYPAENLLDGNTGAEARWSAQGFPQSVVIDYGEVKNITGTRLWTYQNRAYQYTVEVSNNPNSGFIQIVNRNNNTTTGSPIADNFAAQTGRYVRLTVTGASGYAGDWVSITEFEISSSSASVSYPLIASVSAAQNGYPAENLFDNDTGSEARWSAQGFPQSVVIDYGEVKNITGTRLWTYQNRAYRFTVEVSNNPTSGFVQIVNRNNNTNTGSPIADNFAAQSGRYVRLTVMGASGYTGDWVSITEFEITTSSNPIQTSYPLIVSASAAQNGYPAENLFDNDTGQQARWSAQGFPQSVVIDYGEVKNITGTRLWTYQNRAYQYTVEVSNNPTSGFVQIVNRNNNTTTGSPITDNFAAQSGRYVRLTVTGASGYAGDWVSITEFEIITNPVQISYPLIVSASDAQSGYPAENLFDNDTGSEARWSAQGFPQSVVIDYGEVKNITGTRLWTYQNRAYQYTVEVSNNPTSGFVQIVNRNNNTTAGSPIVDNFATKTGRYVRLTVMGASGYTGDWVSVTEFEIASSTISYPIIASFSEEQIGNPADNLIDDNTSAGARWSAQGFPQTIVIDYGESLPIVGTKLWTYQNRAYQYTVEVSQSQNSGYQLAVNRSNNLEVGSPITNSFSVKQGRYVKLTVTGASGYTGDWVSLPEFKIDIQSPNGGVTTRSSDRELLAQPMLSQKAELKWYHWIYEDRGVDAYVIQHFDFNQEKFVDIKTVLPTIDNNALFNYTYIHQNPLLGENLYQVRIEFSDGSVEYSGYETVTFEAQTVGMTLAPNPAQNELNIDLSNFRQEPVYYFVSNLQGRVLFEGNFDTNHADVEKILLDKLQNGLYIFYAKPKSHRRITQKFVVMKDY